MTQLELLSHIEPTRADAPSGKQHRAALVALWNEQSRGLTGEECAQRCGIRLATTATTRLEEMSVDGDVDRFPVPLVCKSDRKRSTSSGRMATVWVLTNAGEYVAGALAEVEA